MFYQFSAARRRALRDHMRIGRIASANRADPCSYQGPARPCSLSRAQIQSGIGLLVQSSSKEEMRKVRDGHVPALAILLQRRLALPYLDVFTFALQPPLAQSDQRLDSLNHSKRLRT